MVEADVATDLYLNDRKSWRPFCHLIHYTKMYDTPAIKSLSGDVLDKYHDMRLRESDMMECRLTCARIVDSIQNPLLKKNLSEVQPVGVEIQGTYVLPVLSVMTRMNRETIVYFHVRAVRGQVLPKDQHERIELENKHFSVIASFISNEPWYSSEYVRFKSAKLGLKVNYDDDIPDILLSEIYYKACTTFCPQLEPLVYFFHSVMSEFYEENEHDKVVRYDWEWLKIHKTAMLVAFFLQHCGLIPLIMRDADVFLPANVNWEKVKEWEEGKPFFTPEYEKESQKLVLESEFAEESLGNLFFLMLEFYTNSCPLGEGRIIIDKGTHPELMAHEKDCLVFDSILLRRTADHFPLKTFYRSVLKSMQNHLAGRKEQGGRVGEDLMKIRRDMVTLRLQEAASKNSNQTLEKS